jgi:uncharacterized protein YecT (DUF1311 family)
LDNRLAALCHDREGRLRKTPEAWIDFEKIDCEMVNSDRHPEKYLHETASKARALT